MIQYLYPFIISCLISTGLIFIFLRYGKKFFPAYVRRDESNKTLRLGGVAIGLAFLLTILFSPNLVIDRLTETILFGSALILLFGLMDDWRERSWRWQIIIQLSVAVLVFLGGARILYISRPFFGGLIYWDSGWGLMWSFLVGTLWIVAIINALNWLDGIDGLTGGVTLISALTIFFLSLKPEVYQPPVAILSLALSGAILGFLFFNFPPAKIFVGTGGTFFLGFIIAVLAIFAGTKIATTCIILLMPIVDFVRVILTRLYCGQKPYLPDNRHFHFLLRRAGWSDRKIAVFFLGGTLLLAGLAFFTRPIGKILTGIFFLICLFFTYRKINR